MADLVVGSDGELLSDVLLTGFSNCGLASEYVLAALAAVGSAFPSTRGRVLEWARRESDVFRVAAESFPTLLITSTLLVPRCEAEAFEVPSLPWRLHR